MEKIAYFDNTDSIFNNEPVVMGKEGLAYLDPLEWIGEQIENFNTLPNNWDGYGAIPPFIDIIDKTKSFLKSLDQSIVSKISDIFPLPHGTIKIKWENAFDESISLEIGRNTFSYILYLNSAKPKPIDGKDIYSITPELTSDINQLFGKNVPLVFY